jgi:hypothetical protein
MIEFIVNYILDENWINKFFITIAIIGPIIGLSAGLLIDKFKKNRSFKFTIMSLSIGFLGTLNLVLWKLYERFTEYFGLASVKNLVFNFLFFLIIGAILGAVFSLLWRFLNHQKIDEAQ